MDDIILGILILLLIAIYFMPTLIAYGNKTKHKNAICVLNLFLGWTVIGWIACLIWVALVSEKKV